MALSGHSRQRNILSAIGQERTLAGIGSDMVRAAERRFRMKIARKTTKQKTPTQSNN
jgi:hypothetical protein